MGNINNNEEIINELVKVVTTDSEVVFITKIENDYFWWAVEREIIEKYFNHPADELTNEEANVFINDEDNADEGGSCGGFNTLEEAEADYMGGGLWFKELENKASLNTQDLLKKGGLSK